MRSSPVVPFLTLLGLAACGSDPATPPPANTFTGTLTISSANPTGNTSCLATAEVVFAAAGANRRAVTVAGGECLSFSAGDGGNYQPATIAGSCNELNAPGVLVQGVPFVTSPLSGPRTCGWQDLAHPPPAGGGGGGY